MLCIVFKNIYNIRKVVKCTRKVFHQSMTWVFKEEITPAFQEGADQETITGPVMIYWRGGRGHIPVK